MAALETNSRNAFVLTVKRKVNDYEKRWGNSLRRDHTRKCFDKDEQQSSEKYNSSVHSHTCY